MNPIQTEEQYADACLKLECLEASPLLNFDKEMQNAVIELDKLIYEYESKILENGI